MLSHVRQLKMLTFSVFLMTHLLTIGLLIDVFTLPEFAASLYTLILITVFERIEDSIQFRDKSISFFKTPKKTFERRKPHQIPHKSKDSNRIHKKELDEKQGMISPQEITRVTNKTSAQKSNLYIDRWKNLNMNISPQFPLDRLAFLNSRTSLCDQKHIFFLRNTQLKQMARKNVNQDKAVHQDTKSSFDEDYHPKKLITDLFAIYVHRRSHFFRSRKVWAVSRRQFTMNYLMRQQMTGGIDTIINNLMFVGKGPYCSEDPNDESSSSCEEFTNAEDLINNVPNIAAKKGLKARFKNSVSSAMTSIKKKRWAFSSKNSEFVQDTNDESSSSEECIRAEDLITNDLSKENAEERIVDSALSLVVKHMKQNYYARNEDDDKEIE